MIMGELKDCRSMRLELLSLNERKQELRSMMERVTTIYSNSGSKQSKKSNDKIGDQIAQMEQIDLKIAKRMTDLFLKIENIETLMQTLPEHKKEVLRLYFFDGLKWREVADKTSYSREHCWRLQHQAIKYIEKMQHNVTSKSVNM